MMTVDGGATFNSIPGDATMSNPEVLAVRKLVEAAPNQELITDARTPAIVKIKTRRRPRA